MKYFVIADVHGFYDEMIQALNEAGFDKDNPNHTLVSCGDVIDRGQQPIQVLEYLVNLPRKILVRGNHEDLLNALLRNEEPTYCDYYNGTAQTVEIMAAEVSPMNFIDWPSKIKAANKLNIYKEYLKLLVNYFETDKYIFVHGWIPCTCKIIDKFEDKYTYIKNWRDVKNKEWRDARWYSGIDCTIQEVFEPNKTIVCGHWHSSAWHEHFEGKKEFEDNSPYISDNVIALDTCTVLSKKVNVVVLED